MLNSELRTATGLENRAGSADYCAERWYAAYTRARHEKKVAAHLEMKRVEVFIPLYGATHNWNGRRADLELPLFPGYVFVRIALQDRLRVLEAPSVIHLVSSGGLPLPLADTELEQLRSCLSLGLKAEPIPYLHTGDLVRVVHGPLAGWTGRVLRRDGETRFVLSVDLIMRSIAVRVEASHLERLCTANSAAA